MSSMDGSTHRDHLIKSGEYVNTGTYMPGIGLGQFLTGPLPAYEVTHAKEWWSEYARKRYLPQWHAKGSAREVGETDEDYATRTNAREG